MIVIHGEINGIEVIVQPQPASITHGTQSGFQTDVVHLFKIYRFKHPFAKPRPLHFLPAEVAAEKKMVFIWLDMAKIALVEATVQGMVPGNV